MGVKSIVGSYRVVCTLVGLAAGWLPLLFHGPIPAKRAGVIRVT